MVSEEPVEVRPANNGDGNEAARLLREAITDFGATVESSDGAKGRARRLSS